MAPRLPSTQITSTILHSPPLPPLSLPLSLPLSPHNCAVVRDNP